MSANEKQVAGNHYQTVTFDIPQHWDIVYMHNLDYFQGQITKYVMRWKNKNGVQDLKKALHFIEKYIELNSPEEEPTQVAINKYAADYQERLSEKMAKMRLDAMTGIPDHLREIAAEDSAISPMLQKYWGGTSEEPLPNGYVNQDGPDV